MIAKSTTVVSPPNTAAAEFSGPSVSSSPWKSIA